MLKEKYRSCFVDQEKTCDNIPMSVEIGNEEEKNGRSLG